MAFITGRHVPRRTFLRGAGAAVALPFLDAMVPAGRPWLPNDPVRLVAVESVHGAAGCCPWGSARYLWTPKNVGQSFDLSPSALLPLEPYREYLTIISNTDVRMAEAYDPREIGADHFRSSAVFLTQCHPTQTEGSDVFVGTSLDQMYARRFGQDTAIPSMQLCIENVDNAGGCAYGYSCVYTDMITWASPTEPLPMIRDPRVAFDMLFGPGGSRDERAARRRQRPGLDHGTLGTTQGGTQAERSPAPGSIPRRHSRGRAPHPGHRSSQRHRRGAGTTGSPSRGARFFRRAHAVDVRSPGSGIRVGHDSGLHLQDRA